jgi:hypothetical protein
VQTPAPASESQCQAECATAIISSHGSSTASWSQLPSKAMNSTIIPRTDVCNKALEYRGKQGQQEPGPQEYLQAMLPIAEAQHFHQISQLSPRTNLSSTTSTIYETPNAEAPSRVTNKHHYTAYSRKILPRPTADFCNTNNQGHNVVPQYQPADLRPSIPARNPPLLTAMQHQNSIATHRDNSSQSVPSQRTSAGEAQQTSESCMTLQNYIENLWQRASQSFASGDCQEHVARTHADGQPTPHNALQQLDCIHYLKEMWPRFTPSQQQTQQPTGHITYISQQISLPT